MEDSNQAHEEAEITPPDQRLRVRIGSANLDKLFSDQAITQAETVIANSADVIYDDCVAEADRLARAAKALDTEPAARASHLSAMSIAAFTLRSGAALGGYELVALLAASLRHLLQKIGDAASPTSRERQLVAWHVESIDEVLRLKIRGMGGKAGEGIRDILKTLGFNTESQAAPTAD
jgi:hypothetical protein